MIVLSARYRRWCARVLAGIVAVGAGAGAGLCGGCAAVGQRPDLEPAESGVFASGVASRIVAAAEVEDGVSLGRGMTVVVEGDWEDVDAAVAAGVKRCAVAIMRREPAFPFLSRESIPAGDPTRSVGLIDFVLVSLRGGEGVVRLERVDDGVWSEGMGPVRIRVTSSIGAIGEASVERCVVQSVGERLEALAGVEVAPVSFGG